MLQRAVCFTIMLAGMTAGLVRGQEAPASPAPTAVVCAKDASFPEALAAKEIRRYAYLRTGTLLPLVHELRPGGLIVVGAKTQPLVRDLLGEATLREAADALAADQYLLRTLPSRAQDGGPVLLVVGGDGVGTLYGAYRLAEHLGVRFYMHGDVVPDEKTTLAALRKLDETGKPLFDRRGIQPFHDFPEGPDWWSAEDYKAVLGQLPKMRMNFFGLHTYPQGGVGPEPLVWIGPPSEIGEGGKVKASYPSRHFTTSNITGAWGYAPMKTSEYLFGAAELFDRDDFGADYMTGTYPWSKMSPEQCNDLFERMGATLKDSFAFARRLGIKTCVGTETPLIIPDAVKTRLKAAGKNPDSPAVVQEVYEGMFRRIAQTHPVDYYWFWTPEDWTWSAVPQQKIDATMADFRAAMAAAEKVKAPFTLATCGWVLGPPQQPALFDNVLPKTMPMSCISRMVGNSPVEPGFVRVEGRPKWSIPWMEDDPGMILPQLWAGRMRRDAADSLAYGCTGLMGIHWRTRILGPNVSALAKAAWDQSGWNPNYGKKSPQEVKQPAGPLGGNVAAFPNNAIAGTEDPSLYQTVRYDVQGYRVDVPNGAYAVTLKFCEPHYKEKGKRVFGVKLQGKEVIERLDIFEKVGPNKALDYTFKDVQVANGQVSIDFVYQTELPSIAAIVVEGPAATRKINCGGPAYKDFAADTSVSAGGKPRYLPADDFYLDWATAEFGPEAAKAIAPVFVKMDGHLPRPADWIDGPGGIRPDPRPWEQVSKEYALVDALAALMPQVRGAGNQERFDYWLSNFRYHRAMAQVNCTWARYEAAMQKVRAEKDPEARKKLARDLALPVRRELVAQATELHRYLLATVSTYGELGTVCNWQQHSLNRLLTGPGKELAAILGEPLRADAAPTTKYSGPPRLIVPTLRTALVAGEPLKLTVIMAGVQPQEAGLHWRPLGAGEFTKAPLVHVARGVYTATLPAESTKADLEYYVQASDGRGKVLVWPSTAPKLNQTVVIAAE